MKKKSLVLFCAVLLAGCAGQQVFDEGRALIESGNLEAGLAKVQEASKLDPRNREYRTYYLRERDTALQRHLTLADQARLQGQFDSAEEAYKRVLALDAQNTRAQQGLEAARADRRHRALVAEAADLQRKGNLAAAQAKTREVLSENGNHREAQQLLRRLEERSMRAAVTERTLSGALRRPVSLNFRDASIRNVLDVLSRQSGLNFIFDRDVRADVRTTISVRNTSLDDALRFILVTNQLERKVLNENTVLVYPNTPAKAREYQELVTKTFYLGTADAKQMANLVRSLVKTKDLFIDEKLNVLVIRDTPDAVRMAERLVANHDLADPEVMLEVEVLEVGSSLLSELGLRFPDQLSYSIVGSAGTPGSVTLPEWLNRNSSLVQLSVTNPLLILNLKNQTGRTNLLANPRIRVRNKDKAKVHIGDKVPVITTTTTATGFASESVTYLDVGLKLDVEPVVHLEDEVAIKVALEVSNIVREIKSSTGTITYQVGTRNASTALRLKDGETQMLAGLIADEDRKTAHQVPGLGSLPVVGRLFGSHSDTSTKTEIVLLITPRIVRGLARPEFRFEEFTSGTEAAIGAAPLFFSTEPLGAVLPMAPNTEPGTSGRVSLAGPTATGQGQELAVDVTLNLGGAVLSGLLDFAFDASAAKFVRAEPGPLLSAVADVSFRSSAPEGAGRVSISFGSKSEVKGSGQVARLIFQPLPNAAGRGAMRLEAASFVDAGGKLVSAQIPAPLNLSVQK